MRTGALLAGRPHRLRVTETEMDQHSLPIHHHTPPLPPTPAEGDLHIHLSTEALILAIVLVWSLWGLWIYLTDREIEGGSSWGFCFMCGPAAWVTAFWHLTHRPPKKPLLPKEEWEKP